MWFAKNQPDVIRRGVFTSVADLGNKLRKYICAYSRSLKALPMDLHPSDSQNFALTKSPGQLTSGSCSASDMIPTNLETKSRTMPKAKAIASRVNTGTSASVRGGQTFLSCPGIIPSDPYAPTSTGTSESRWRDRRPEPPDLPSPSHASRLCQA
jgi:hypothetical protein